MKRVLIFIVTYNAERTVQSVLSRVPDSVLANPDYQTEILLIDDASQDRTVELGRQYRRDRTRVPLTILRNPVNLGYGGNQKLGYRYAIDEGFDIVVLLHGDGQYAPERLPELLAPLLEERCEAVFGSRMMAGGRPLAGGMPLYKFVGNKILTAIENRVLGAKLSEWHSGYRLYATGALAQVPFERNANDFSFDTDIIIQLLLKKFRIEEIPVPTFYGDETSHVEGIPYALKIVRACLTAQAQRFGIGYDDRFDMGDSSQTYQPKYGYPSSHSMALEAIEETDEVAALGCGPLATIEPLLNKAASMVVIDKELEDGVRFRCRDAHALDLDEADLDEVLAGRRVDVVLALDVIEHLNSPELFLERIRNARTMREARVVLTTPNVAFAPVRLMLLLGAFNYGKRGILDMTHRRLFTFASLQRLVESQGFELQTLRGVPAPFPLAVGEGPLGALLLRLNQGAIALSPGLFSYQIYCELRPAPTTAQLLERSKQTTTDYPFSRDSPG
ncbi:MAG: bifunctional glycosyltransferase/class I SAM-dependent methyltransferase [Myxococcales bacterium]|nr:bifunctional glycosyltransferase/class I SAM-dependent methyltransferase [Myxococcales bacterium]